jgi:hypothetical protein
MNRSLQGKMEGVSSVTLTLDRIEEIFYYILQFIPQSKDINSLMRTSRDIRKKVIEHQEVLLGTINFPFIKNFSRLRYTGLIILKEKEDITDLLQRNRGDLQFVATKQNALYTFDRDLSLVYLRYKISIQINGNIVIITCNGKNVNIAVHGKINSNGDHVNSFLAIIIEWIPSQLSFNLEWTTCDDSHDYVALKGTLEWIKYNTFYRKDNLRTFRLPFHKLIPRDIARSIGKHDNYEKAVNNIMNNQHLHREYVLFVYRTLQNIDNLIMGILSDKITIELISTDPYDTQSMIMYVEIILLWIKSYLTVNLDSIKGGCVILTMSDNVYRDIHIFDKDIQENVNISNIHDIRRDKFNILLNVY